MRRTTISFPNYSGGRSRPVVVLLVIIALISIGMIDCSNKENLSSLGYEWKRMSTPVDIFLRGVWGSSPSNVYAVGSEGVILHYDGRQWTEESFHADDQLNDIWGSAADNIYVVGRAGQIIHFDGSEWEYLPADNETNYNCVHGVNDTMIFIGWTSPTTFGASQYNGDSLRVLGTGMYSLAIWASYGKVHPVVNRPVLDLWLHGAIRRDSFHYDGKKWEFGGYGAGRALWGLTWDEVYSGGPLGEIRKFNGTEWVDQDTERLGSIYDIWGTGGLGLFSVGYQGIVTYSIGGAWKRMESDTDRTLWAIYGFEGGEAFAVGEGGTIIHFGPN